MSILGTILAKHGPLGLALVVLAYLLMRQADTAREERSYQAMVLMDTLADLRADVARSCQPRAP